MYAICNVIYGYPLSNILYDEPPMPPEIKDELLELVEEGDDGGKFLHSYYSGCGDYKPCAIGIDCAEFDETQYTELTELYQKVCPKLQQRLVKNFLIGFETRILCPKILRNGYWITTRIRQSCSSFGARVSHISCILWS